MTLTLNEREIAALRGISRTVDAKIDLAEARIAARMLEERLRCALREAARDEERTRTDALCDAE